MKFHCDRCNTRYSISDERVQGKILKIRCKNCSTAITVRESTAAAPASKRARSNLEGAFALALDSSQGHPDNEPSSVAPTTLATQWYLASDGEQVGPFDLEEARKWVSSIDEEDAEIYCWSEGFDDWLAIDKVSHFRGMTRGAHSNGLDTDTDTEQTVVGDMSGMGDSFSSKEEAPKPLFAATLASLEAEAGSADVGIESSSGLSSSGLPPLPRAEPQPPHFGASASPGPALFDADLDGAEQSLEFDIGEASRVVKLPQLAQLARVGLAMGAPGALLGERKNGEASAVSVLPPPPTRKRSLVVPLIASIAVLLAVVGVLIFLTVGDEDDSSGRVARGSVGGGGNLGYTFRDTRRKIVEETKQKSNEKARASVTTRRGGARGTRTVTSEGKSVTTPGYDEVAIGRGAGQNGGPLDGNDLSKVYRNNQYLMKRCYERSLKKDPFLKVPKIWVSLRVGKNGSVSSVKIPGLAGSDLGNCLNKIISRWKFRKTSEVFDGKFPVVFN